MPAVRVYVPLGAADLRTLATTRSLPVGDPPRAAYAVTAALEAANGGLDDEELEYAAFRDAVVAAAVARDGDSRRVVAAADAEPAWLGDGSGPVASAVALQAELPLARVASFHVDEEPGAPADRTSDLLWYDVTEIDEVAGLL